MKNKYLLLFILVCFNIFMINTHAVSNSDPCASQCASNGNACSACHQGKSYICWSKNKGIKDSTAYEKSYNLCMYGQTKSLQEAKNDCISKLKNVCEGSCANSSYTACTECKKSQAYRDYENDVKACNDDPFNANLKTPGSSDSGTGTGSGDTGTGSGSGGTGGSNNGGGSSGANPSTGIATPLKSGDKCEDYTGSKTGELLRDAYNILKILVPIIIIGMGVKEFGTSVIEQNGDGLIKSTKKLGIRLAIAVLFYAIPILLDLIFELLEIETCLL